MPRAGFYNDNEYRAYPFVFKKEYSSVTKLPTAAIVDCGFIMGIDSEYDPATHFAYLKSITRTGDSFEFLFDTNAPRAEVFPLKFTAAIATPEWQTIFGESAPDTENNFCAEEPAWEGFIVIGRLDDLIELLPTAGSLSFYAPEAISPTTMPDYTVEPARIQSLVMGYVRAICVGNYERPRVPTCEELESSSSSPAPERQILVNATCIRNNVKLKAGYNCAITQNTGTNTLTVAPFRGDRSGTDDPENEICQYGSELPLYEGHVPPEGSVFLSGGPACKDLITSINGVGGSNITIAAGPGIQIVSDEDNSIKIDVTPNIVQQDCG